MSGASYPETLDPRPYTQVYGGPPGPLLRCHPLFVVNDLSLSMVDLRELFCDEFLHALVAPVLGHPDLVRVRAGLGYALEDGRQGTVQIACFKVYCCQYETGYNRRMC